MKMTIEEMHVALMEVMGWTIAGNSRTKTGRKHGPPDYGLNPATGKWENLPPLTLDLCHEVEVGFSDFQHAEFRNQLANVLSRDGCNNYHRGLVSATAQQRCEAILRTKGMWRE